MEHQFIITMIFNPIATYTHVFENLEWTQRLCDAFLGKGQPPWNWLFWTSQLSTIAGDDCNGGGGGCGQMMMMMMMIANDYGGDNENDQ